MFSEVGRNNQRALRQIYSKLLKQIGFYTMVQCPQVLHPTVLGC